MNYPQIKPTLNLDFSNTKTLDPRINFRRGTPGAYYDGKTYAKAEENLISYSEDFNDTENYWSEIRATLTGSQVSPIDSTSAYELSQISTGVAGVLLVNTGKIKLQIGKQYVSSVYVKASSSNYFAIAEEVSRNNPTGTPAFTYFNLSNSGEVMLSHENHIASIQNVGNQWYRCSIMFTAKIEQDYTVMFYLDSGSSQSIISEPQNVQTGSSVYLWGAQLEQRDSVTAYTPTTGTPITKYQPQLMFASPDQPRFDHDALTGESKGLLIEESRTNLIEYSEDIGGIYWSRITSFELNAICAPDGTISADRIYQSDATDYQSRDASVNIVSGFDYVYSVYAKDDNLGYLRINIAGVSGITYNLTNGTVTIDGSTNSTVSAFSGDIEFVGNGWYRCVYKFTSGSTVSSTARNVVTPSNSTVQGDGKSGVYIWGAQFEVGSFPTSYIKTSGASTTRSADNASITGENFSSWYRQDEGSFYVESGTAFGADYIPYLGVGLDGDGDGYRFNSIVSYSDQVFLNNWNGVSLTSGLKINKNGTSEKIATVYKDDDFAMSVNGSDAVSDTDGLHYKDMKTLYIGQTPYSGTNRYLGNCIKKLSYYPRRLTNEQLQQLTK